MRAALIQTSAMHIEGPQKREEEKKGQGKQESCAYRVSRALESEWAADRWRSPFYGALRAWTYVEHLRMNRPCFPRLEFASTVMCQSCRLRENILLSLSLSKHRHYPARRFSKISFLALLLSSRSAGEHAFYL